ncbi:MAG: type I pantothenate kinase [Stappia sp.]|uniref:type I pantothenate kinase n=1 Tax=Stappia sp. TaxID=1870903 RepID=UPI000C4A5801|nr:type I pantothenate kinase [Stappia sp.]MAA97350.1 type I pantothenate kinase [Stappia sp.]MBM18493.1 type I pantothenate kinase [Stappia sp.]|tara:strand:- start:15 stop:980 length:966 start_codon:yes stop_codon:yes gene_type:complete
MEQTVSRYRDDDLSPYRVFSEDQWARLRADTPMTLTASEVARLQSLNDPVSIAQVESILLPLSRLLAYYVEATQQLHRATNRFLGSNEVKNPFVIGLAGSVAVGKSTTARLLQALLARWPASPKVDLVTTDGFLHPNAVLEREGLMRRKGFPESYDRTTLLTFLSDLKAGRRHVRAPVYSHFYYDVMPDQYVTVDRPDILILEGLNVLQTSNLPRDGKEVPFVSDFFDFSIYIDADEDVLHEWYVKRFMRLRETAFRDPGSYFNKYSMVGENEALEIAEDLWREINLVNLQENILPTRPRADLILHKNRDHAIDEVRLRKL